MTIFQGDCLKLIKNIEDDCFDFVFTSPPYNRKRNDKYSEYNDTLEDYFSFLKKSIDQCLRVCSGNVCFNIQKNYYNKKDVFKIIGHYSEIINEIIIWEKTNPMPAAAKAITNSYEFFIFFNKNKQSLNSNTTYTKNIISTSVNSKMPKNHKAVMKQEIADYFIEKFTKKGDIVLDPFMGIGTTGISCKKLDRLFCGMELSDIYFEQAKKNLN